MRDRANAPTRNPGTPAPSFQHGLFEHSEHFTKTRRQTLGPSGHSGAPRPTYCPGPAPTGRRRARSGRLLAINPLASSWRTAPSPALAPKLPRRGGAPGRRSQGRPRLKEVPSPGPLTGRSHSLDGIDQAVMWMESSKHVIFECSHYASVISPSCYWFAQPESDLIFFCQQDQRAVAAFCKACHGLHT